MALPTGKDRAILMLLILGSAPVLLPRAAIAAGNAQCWGDDSRQDISCRALTENFLLSMRGATRDEIIKAMGVTGREVELGLHFISNYSKGEREGSGIVNFSFDGTGHVSVITADVDHAGSKGPSMEFIWNASTSPLPFCSDFPGSRSRCDDDTPAFKRHLLP
jgi:hypothetical protein